MAEPTAPATSDSQTPYVWQTHLDTANASSTPYQQHFNPHIVSTLAHPPRVLLDVGCSSGNLGAHIKKTYPACKVIGIEPNRASAELARSCLDQVLCGKIEDFVLADEGIAKSSIDTVIMADVLEHLYDPWRVMVELKPNLAPDAQMILSIPNTRHLGLLSELIDHGNWQYAERGLLDITHIRFFTLKEIARFLQQTGYGIERVHNVIDNALAPLYENNKNKPEVIIRAGRLCLEKITPRELAELCSLQFLVCARPI